MNEFNIKILICVLCLILLILNALILIKINRDNKKEKYCADITGGYQSPCNSDCSFGCVTNK